MIARGVVLVLALLLGGCATASGDQVVVFAAASLTDALEVVVADFEAANPDTDVALQLAGSQTLVQQLAAGAPADVLATADEATFADAADTGRMATAGTVFASAPLTIAVAPGNPLGVSSVQDLTRDDLVVVLAAPEVPAGARAAALLEAAALELSPASLEVSVRAALARVEAGEADAALVYATDVVAADGRVDAVDPGVPPTSATTARYVVGVVADSDRPGAAQAFVDHLTGPEGRRVLDAHGFGAP